MQHNLRDGTYKRYTLNADWFELYDVGTWTMENCSYTEEHDGQSYAKGTLAGDSMDFKMDVDVPSDGKYCYTPTFKPYDKGHPVTVPKSIRKEEPREPIADIPADAEFYIKPAANVKKCLSVRSETSMGKSLYSKPNGCSICTAVSSTCVCQGWEAG